MVVFCLTQPRPWLALLIAVPYLVTVVAMGYTRQGVAIGIAMMGISALMGGGVFRFVLWVALAATFHKFVMKAVHNYEYDNTPKRYEDRVGQMYWDVIKEQHRFN